MKRGVSLYSYQQTQFFKELDLEGQIREVGTALHGADGIEVIDEMSLRYPNPGPAFVDQWFGWMDAYGTKPVTLDVGMDVLQFRDHVMSHEECAERLRHDLRLAKTLGFQNVRVLSVMPLDVMLRALPLAEELDIRLGKEVHQPMALEGQQVSEIIEHVERTGTRHLGVVPDFGIFGTRPSEAMLAWYVRRGAKEAACDVAVELSASLRRGTAPFRLSDLESSTAGNLRAEYKRYVVSGDCDAKLKPAFEQVKNLALAKIPDATDLDLIVAAEGMMLSNTSADTLRQIVPHLVNIHAKFYNMSEIPGQPGQYQDISIDYPSAIAALKQGGYTGYLNTEYEGQRYFQDGDRSAMMSEIDQVRRHQEMLKRLIEA